MASRRASKIEVCGTGLVFVLVLVDSILWDFMAVQVEYAILGFSFGLIIPGVIDIRREAKAIRARRERTL